jgi:hypothetical protein
MFQPRKVLVLWTWDHQVLSIYWLSTGGFVPSESLLGKVARSDDIIDRKFVQMDTELEKVVGLVGDKIEKEVGKIATEFAEAMDVEEEWRAASEAKTASLEVRLGEAFDTISSLTTLVVALQSRVGDSEGADLGCRKKVCFTNDTIRSVTHLGGIQGRSKPPKRPSAANLR